MAVTSVNTDTGAAPLPDFGSLKYNGVAFSALFHSHIAGRVVKDDAGRITKFLEWRLEVEVVVTLPADMLPDLSSSNTNQVWENLRKKLSAQGGTLTYQGRGFGNVLINQPGGGGVRDVAFGPRPEIIDFQPYGRGRSARLTWACVFTVTELPITGTTTLKTASDPTNFSILQMNYEAGVTFDDAGYSTQSVRGVLEVPITRTPDESRKLQRMVDAFRQAWLDLQVDLTNFKMPRRSFTFSPDRRTINWSFEAEELPPMRMPPGCPRARGSMRVRPLKTGKALLLYNSISWAVDLTVTYTVRRDWPRYTSLYHFYALLWYRMHCASLDAWAPPGFQEAGVDKPENAPQQPAPKNDPYTPMTWNNFLDLLAPGAGAGFDIQAYFRRQFSALGNEQKKKLPKARAILMDFGFEEGLYEDSPSITYNASWTAIVPMSALMAATGMWRQAVVDPDATLWQASIKDIAGWSSWLENHPNPAADVVVDLNLGIPQPQRNPFLFETRSASATTIRPVG